MPRNRNLLVGIVLVLACAVTAQAAMVTVFKEGSELNSGGAIDTAFAAATVENVVSQTVHDTVITTNTSAAYVRQGDVASSAGILLFKFDLSGIGAGAKIYKAQLRMRAGNGNNAMVLARITTHDWLENTACLAGPDAPVSPNRTWGPDADAYFSAADYAAPVNFESAPVGAAWCVKDVTADVQALVNGVLPNYGWYVNSGNHSVKLSENATDGDRPALFVSWDPNAAPDPVADLAVTGGDWYRIDLQWTTPQDNPPGAIHHYDIRMSGSPIDDTNFEAATPVAAPTPGEPGTIQTLSVTGLTAETTYYFAIRCYDLTGLASGISNGGLPVSGTTNPLDVVSPGTIDLQVLPADVYPNHAIIRWTAVGDDEATGMAVGYDLRYSSDPITDEASFAAATAVTGVAAPKAAGSAEEFAIHGLTPSTTYYFAIKARDEVPNWSSLSNAAVFTTDPPDPYAPMAIVDLHVAAPHIYTVYLD